MKTVVLDKSAAKGAPRGGLKELRGRFEFILPEALLFEIVTENIDEWDKLSQGEKDEQHRIIDKNLKKVVDETGDLWIKQQDAFIHEIEKGSSAKYMKRVSIGDLPPISTIIDKQACLKYEHLVENFISLERKIKDDQAYKELRSLNEERLFRQISKDFCSKGADHDIAEEARDYFTCYGERSGIKVSAGFKPDRKWLCFGITLAIEAYRSLKFWKYGDTEKSSPAKKPANSIFDLFYIGHMAIADGILSTDKEQLKLAWALWPEKRESIYEYNQDKHKHEVFKPEWKS